MPVSSAMRAGSLRRTRSRRLAALSRGLPADGRDGVGREEAEEDVMEADGDCARIRRSNKQTNTGRQDRAKTKRNTDVRNVRVARAAKRIAAERTC